MGIDITEEFCRAARMLTARLGMNDAVSFRHGNAVDMPFDDESFDVVWSQNTLMNIEQKRELLSQIRRVLKPGGIFAFEALLAGREGELHFPVFWAASPDLNYLATVQQMQAWLSEAGLVKVAWLDTSTDIIEAGRKRLAALEQEGPPPLGLGVIVPRDVTTKMRNSLKNTEEGRTVAVQALYARPD
jgi:SAM-dependent methyltransferase